MKELTPYKQVLSHGCLAACFLMLLNHQKNKKYSSNDEKKILLSAMNRVHKFYVSGVPIEVSRRYKQQITVFVDNKYFTTILQKEFKGTTVKTVHSKITLSFIKKLVVASPVICHIDDHYIGDYSHASHFVIIEKDTDKNFSIIDPLQGKRLLLSHKKLQDSIKSLKTHIKMCPLVLVLK